MGLYYIISPGETSPEWRMWYRCEAQIVGDDHNGAWRLFFVFLKLSSAGTIYDASNFVLEIHLKESNY